MNIREAVIDFMSKKSYKPMDIDGLSKVFQVKKFERKEFKKTLKDMERDGQIIETNSGHFGIADEMGIVIGKLEGHSKGYGFVITDDMSGDVFIPSSGMNGAMNGDKVACRITKEKADEKKCEGEIVKVIERANEKVIGRFESSRDFAFVVPEDKRIYDDIFIPKDCFNDAKNGDVVIAKITKWPRGRRNPEGKVKEIVGKFGDSSIDALTVMKEHSLPEAFPEKVIRYVENIESSISEDEIKRRKDLRDLKIVTIDGDDAKDLDDAVSIEKLSNGNYKLGVHIADVSNYVKERSPLDKEALKRGNSVYLIDRVIPMLPKELSNGICSLNPKEDRLTLTCMMEIDNTGKVVDHNIFESVIRTSERMTYNDVTKILEGSDPALLKRYDYLLDDFKLMEELCQILHKKRIERGAIDFDFAESKITLDENGKPVSVEPYERGTANRIIEEFMLVCNETIAEHMFWANVPFVYRVHENPDEEKLLRFNEFAHNLGYVVKASKEVHPKALQEVIEKVKGTAEETVVSMLLLRSLKLAKYSPECTGHFGLAAKYYCHFTSPIRRYPDLIIHRIIKEYINGRIDQNSIKKLQAAVAYASEQSSETERVAEDAERELDDIKKTEYMSEKIGEKYDGIISSVTSFGLFVELPNTIEGLIHVTSLDDDYYIYDEKHLMLIGERKKKIYKIGDEVRIKVSKVNTDTHEIFFEFADKNDKNTAADVDSPNDK